jgi:dTDP-4-dehydrorhamnose reductase
MKVLLTGAAGQLGQALIAAQPPQLGSTPLELIATSRTGGNGSIALNLADAEACRAAVLTHQPDWVLNAGAYTAVDKAESEPELALAVNGGAPRAFAEALRDLGQGRLLQVSTDFVFDGSQGHPYAPEQPRRPLGMYGSSKAAGEVAVEELLGAGRGVILRTSWVYGPVGHNFCRTMLRLHRERPQISVVADQVGCPTSTAGLAAACWRVLERVTAAPEALPQTLHWSDAGAASWYDFAVAIGELGVSAGLLERAAEVLPIRTADYPTPAQRPSYSLLDCTASRKALGLAPRHWRQALLDVLQSLVREA